MPGFKPRTTKKSHEQIFIIRALLKRVWNMIILIDRLNKLWVILTWNLLIPLSKYITAISYVTLIKISSKFVIAVIEVFLDQVYQHSCHPICYFRSVKAKLPNIWWSKFLIRASVCFVRLIEEHSTRLLILPSQQKNGGYHISRKASWSYCNRVRDTVLQTISIIFSESYVPR